MMQSLCFYIGLMRLLRRIKPSYEFVNPVCTDSRSPSLTAFKFGNAQQTASFIPCSRAFLVLDISRRRYISQVSKRIVSWVAINVVNITRRPISGNVKPSKPVGTVVPFVYFNNSVPVELNVASRRPWDNFSASFYFPNKFACFGTVVQYCTQLVKCDVRMRHAISLS